MTTARRLIWQYPHWWAVLLCASAWSWLVAGWWNGRHAHGFTMTGWMMMVGAMMLPLVFDHVQVAAARSLWSRRHRAIAAFLCGYGAVSLLAGLALLWVFRALGVSEHGAPSPLLLSVAFAVAAAWQVAPQKRRALTACHRTVPLAPRGWSAHRDCFRYGWTVGRSCLISCGGLMLACVLAGHSLPAMMAAAAVAGAERMSARADEGVTFAALAVVAVAQLALP